MTKIKNLLLVVASAIGLAQAYAPQPEHHLVLPVVEVHSGAGSTVVAKAIQDVKILGAGTTFAVVMSAPVVLGAYEVAGVDFGTGHQVSRVVVPGGHQEEAVIGLASKQDAAVVGVPTASLTDELPSGSKAEIEVLKTTGGI